MDVGSRWELFAFTTSNIYNTAIAKMYTGCRCHDTLSLAHIHTQSLWGTLLRLLSWTLSPMKGHFKQTNRPLRFWLQFALLIWLASTILH